MMTEGLVTEGTILWEVSLEGRGRPSIPRSKMELSLPAQHSWPQSCSRIVQSGLL